MTNEDLKAQMREALARKNGQEQGVHADGPTKEKAHGSEVSERNVAIPMHRRKAGGGGA
ncbi:DUF5302 domain-containing protein [Nocardioides jishulii]|uniref:DUF5302 domain-containing protein n=1 Tax=Nocardioides jishulii TaxID=2575440 RepID=UPI001484ED7C|nr:DUF5302 domain-containing protein [Nocardioides jishulii]